MPAKLHCPADPSPSQPPRGQTVDLWDGDVLRCGPPGASQAFGGAGRCPSQGHAEMWAHVRRHSECVCSENTKFREIGEVLDLQTAAGCSGLPDCCRLPRFAW